MIEGFLLFIGILSWIGGSIGFLSAATIVGQCAALIAILSGVVAVVGSVMIGEMRQQTKLLQYLCDTKSPVARVIAPQVPERGNGFKATIDKILGNR